mmetsp:Transcript_11531/g.24881  ORF Transcript_11531/g.24881 Transcript_11531/m.24881 type:complete len:232 (+) Transcript_11531:3915-4610(+)
MFSPITCSLTWAPMSIIARDEEFLRAETSSVPPSLLPPSRKLLSDRHCESGASSIAPALCIQLSSRYKDRSCAHSESADRSTLASLFLCNHSFCNRVQLRRGPRSIERIEFELSTTDSSAVHELNAVKSTSVIALLARETSFNVPKHAFETLTSTNPTRPQADNDADPAPPRTTLCSSPSSSLLTVITASSFRPPATPLLSLIPQLTINTPHLFVHHAFNTLSRLLSKSAD